MRVKLTARLGDNQQSGLEMDRSYAVHSGPDEQGRVWVFDDNTDSFRTVGPAEYREIPDPLEPHDLVRIDQQPGGYGAVCTCVWRHWEPVGDPDEAAHAHKLHLGRMAIDRHHLTTPVHPLLQEWINDLRSRRRHRQEPER
jgi:hypothetical protein